MSKPLQTFLLNVTVIEGRHYIWPNATTFAVVQIDNRKKYTPVKFSTNSPYYNEYFVFEFLTTFEEIVEKTVNITVMSPAGILTKRKLLGSISFDVGTVWYQKDHQLYHKWAILTSSSDTGGTQGYLKIDVSLLAKGELLKIPPYLNTDDIEGNLFLPEGAASRQRVNFIFDVYRGKDCVKRNPTQEGTKKFDNIPTTQLRISFSGISVKTQVKKNSSAPVWNERLLLPELFPPLCQGFKIELYHESNRRATRYLSLRTISSDDEDGFLPTFGPSFLHFYSPNNLEGYLGKVLLYLQSSLLGDVAEYETKTHLIQSVVIEEYKAQFEEVVLFVAIFEVSSVVNKFSDKPLSFRVSCGASQSDPNTEVTPSLKPKLMNKNYSFLELNERKLLLRLTTTLPDIRRRLYNYNLITKILRDLRSRLDKIEDIYDKHDSETKQFLEETIDFVSSAASKYIDIACGYKLDTDPLLDQQRLKLCLKEMEAVVELSNSLPHLQSVKKTYQKLEKICTRIEALVDIIEDWPQVYLWMISGNKRVAYHIIQPRNVVFSMVEEEKGIHCGVLQTIYLQTEANCNVADFVSSACKMDAMVWMGLERHSDNFYSSLAASSFEVLPDSLTATETHSFQAHAYIFQGRFSPGADKSGLSDPFVHLIIGQQFQETKILRKTLTPVWDQTLIFPRVVLYGSQGFILANPPTVTLEVYDKDECFKNELVGKCVLKPLLKLVDHEKSYPKLRWEKVFNKFNASAEVLAAVDFQEVAEDSLNRGDGPPLLTRVPSEIKPNLVNHRVEVVFWGLRSLKKVQMWHTTKPKIVVECNDASLTSDVLSVKKSLNFTNPVQVFEAKFAEQEEFAPLVSLKMFDCRNFGINAFIGTYLAPMRRFVYVPFTVEEREVKLYSCEEEKSETFLSVESIIESLNETQENTQPERVKYCGLSNCLKRKKKVDKPVGTDQFEEPETEDTSDFDWWTKFYASCEEKTTTTLSLRHKYTLTSELENQPEFDGFSDILQSFPMYKGKRTGDEAVDEENTTGVFKGALRVYKWPLTPACVTPNGLPLDMGVFQDFPSNSPMRYVLRVYCVRGLNLPPKDLTGKSDPYLRLTLNQQVVSDRENHAQSELNPVFGKCFEFNGVFPQDHTLVVTVMDYDLLTSDDLIGETKIDIENRVYTRHRAHCGLPQNYLTSGYCQWRDQQRPTTILYKMCKRFNIPDLHYKENCVTFAGRDFSPREFKPSDCVEQDQQVLALEALKHWAEIPIVGCTLVPEHVETRSLYHPQKPGIEQLWIDVLPVGDLPTPKQVNITPQKPITYELRVIVWNASNVVLQETDVLTGQKKSDIFVKGWVTNPETAQYTDVHYRSLTGEGNFNWRFIFTFDYLISENKIVVVKKKFGYKPQEEKIPCSLTLQIWENDTFSYHDFLGTVSLDLSKLPRGVGLAKLVSLTQLKTKNPSLNLFKVRRTKGWWPVLNYDPKIGEVFAGALELEFELLTKDESGKAPAGFGRDDPQALPKPNRPESSFSWLRSPGATLKFYKKKIIFGVIVFVVTVSLAVFCFKTFIHQLI